MKNLILPIIILSIIANSINAQVNTTSLLDTSYNHVGYRVNSDSLYQKITCSDLTIGGSLVAAFRWQGTQNCGITKYDPHGQVDMSFGNNGLIFIIPNSFNSHFDTTAETISPVDLLVLPDDKFLIAWTVVDNQNFYAYQKMVIVKYNINGEIDTSFADNGYFISNYGEYDTGYSRKLLLLKDEKIAVLGGAMVNYSNGGTNYLPDGCVVVKLMPNGSLDSTFNSVGYRVLKTIEPREWFEVNSNGELLIPYIRYTVDDQFYLSIVKVSSLGDSLVKSDIWQIFTNPDNTFSYSDVDIDNQDKLTFSAFSKSQEPSRLMVFRINPNFTFDNTFGVNGIVYYTDSINKFLRHNIVCDKEGNAYTVSIPYHSNTDSTGVTYIYPNILVLKYNNSGLLANNFGYQGKYTIEPEPIEYNTEPRISLLYNNTKLLITGGIFTSEPSSTQNFFATRLFNDTVSIILGIIDNPIVSQTVTAYPNPVQNSTINLSYELQNKQDISISFFDINGKLLGNLLNKQPRAKGQNTEQLQLPTYPATGTYIITIQAGTYSKSVKIVVQ